MGTHGSKWEVRSLITPIDPTRPSQQLLRKPGCSMHGMSSRDASETARVDLGRPRGTLLNRRTPFATTGKAKEAIARAVGAFWEL
jgi:hypothetical protein